MYIMQYNYFIHDTKQIKQANVDIRYVKTYETVQILAILMLIKIGLMDLT